MAHRHDGETALIVIESAIDKKLISPAVAQTILSSIPEYRRRATAKYLCSNSQSGSETRVRLFLQKRGLTVQPQARIPQVGFVDMLVGNSLIIECDGMEYHHTVAAFENDRRRDFHAQLMGYRVLRLSYSQIWHNWENTALLLAELISTRTYLAPPKPAKL
ncbi:MAG: DUF559 domain-containing protein [Trueperella sp.]|nr:DUF559 domain-containing protein [Trueperella sp.]